MKINVHLFILAMVLELLGYGLVASAFGWKAAAAVFLFDLAGRLLPFAFSQKLP